MMMNDKSQKLKPMKRKSRWLSWLIWSVVGGVVVTGVVVSALPKPVPVEVAQVERKPLVVTVDEDGQARVTDRYVVSTPLSGNLARIELHAGDTVKQGDLVARILPARAPLLDSRSRTEAEAHLAAVVAGLKQSEAQIERAKVARDYSVRDAESTRKLAENGTLSQQELDRAMLDKRSREAELQSAEFGAKVARHEVAMASAALGRMGGQKDDGQQFEVTSPVTGRILRVIEQSEGVVQAGTRLLEIGDPHALELAVDVLTSDAVHIKPGAAAQIVDWGGDDLSGSVRVVEPSAFTRASALGVEEQRVNVVLDLRDPYEKWQELGDGYRVEARIEIYRNPQAVVVPWSSLFKNGEHWAVFAVHQGKAQLRQLEVGRRSALAAEVLAGLEPGERVVLHPSDNVKEGVALESAAMP